MSLGSALPMVPLELEFFSRVHLSAKVLYGGAEQERTTQEWRYCLGFGEHEGYAPRHRPELATAYNVKDHKDDDRRGFTATGRPIRLVWDYVNGEWVTKAELARLYQCSVKEVITYGQFEKMFAAGWKIEEPHLVKYSSRTRAILIDDYFPDAPSVLGCRPKWHGKPEFKYLPEISNEEAALEEKNLLDDLRSIDIARGRDPAAGYFAGLSKKPEEKGKGKAREVIDVDAPPVALTRGGRPRKRKIEDPAVLETIEEGDEEAVGEELPKKKARLVEEEVEAVPPLPVAPLPATTKKTRSRVASKTPAAAPSTRVKSRAASVAPLVSPVTAVVDPVAPLAPVAAAADSVAPLVPVAGPVAPVVPLASSAPSVPSTAAITAAPLGGTRSMSRKASEAPSVVPSAPSAPSAPSTSKGRKRKAEESVDGAAEEEDVQVMAPPAKKARAKKEKEPEVETFARRSTRAKSTTAKAAGLQKNGKWSSAGLKGPNA